MNQSKAIYVLASLSTIFSFIGLMLAASEYLVASRNVDIAQALAPSMEVMAPKVEAPTAETGALSRKLYAQHDDLMSLHGALLGIANDRKVVALQHCVAWIVLCITLSLLMLKLKPGRRQE